MSEVPILKSALKHLPAVKSWMQATLYVVFLIVVAILFMSKGVQQVPLMLVIAAIPLLIIMEKIRDPLPVFMQFILLFFVAFTCIGFLAVAALRTVTVDHDRRNNDINYLQDYYIHGFNRLAESLDAKIVGPIENVIVETRNVPRSYPKYRDAVLKEYIRSPDQEISIDTQLDRVVTFFDTVSNCYYNQTCSDDILESELAQDIRKFWYLFRPIIEEMRTRGYGKQYALSLQKLAEMLHPPEFRSDVTLDNTTKVTRLTFPNG